MPWTLALSEPRLALALKSGNFGGPDFFTRAWEHAGMSPENRMREANCRVGRSLFERGLGFGSSGNISVRLESDGWLITPTNRASAGSTRSGRPA